MKSGICKEIKKKKEEGYVWFPAPSLGWEDALGIVCSVCHDRRVLVPLRWGRGCPGCGVWGPGKGCETPGLTLGRSSQKDSGTLDPEGVRSEFSEGI